MGNKILILIFFTDCPTWKVFAYQLMCCAKESRPSLIITCAIFFPTLIRLTLLLRTRDDSNLIQGKETMLTTKHKAHVVTLKALPMPSKRQIMVFPDEKLKSCCLDRTPMYSTIVFSSMEVCVISQAALKMENEVEMIKCIGLLNISNSQYTIEPLSNYVKRKQ
jgi:hypothetical protein